MGDPVRSVPPSRQPPLFNADKPEILSLPENILDGLSVDAGERRDVLEGEGAGFVLGDLSGHDGQHRLLG
jgi:hypothetical protein